MSVSALSQPNTCTPSAPAPGQDSGADTASASLFSMMFGQMVSQMTAPLQQGGVEPVSSQGSAAVCASNQLPATPADTAPADSTATAPESETNTKPAAQPDAPLPGAGNAQQSTADTELASDGPQNSESAPAANAFPATTTETATALSQAPVPEPETPSTIAAQPAKSPVDQAAQQQKDDHDQKSANRSEAKPVSAGTSERSTNDVSKPFSASAAQTAPKPDGPQTISPGAHRDIDASAARAPQEKHASAKSADVSPSDQNNSNPGLPGTAASSSGDAGSSSKEKNGDSGPSKTQNDGKDILPNHAEGKADFTAALQQAHAARADGETNSGIVSSPNVGLPSGTEQARLHFADRIEAAGHATGAIKDGGSLAIQLDHDGLGKVNIRVSLDNGSVNTQINVQDESARALIENNRNRLVDSLMQEGLSVGGFSVGLRQNGTWQQAGYDGSQGSPQRVLPPLPVQAASARTAKTGSINIFI